MSLNSLRENNTKFSQKLKSVYKAIEYKKSFDQDKSLIVLLSHLIIYMLRLKKDNIGVRSR